MTDTAPTTGDPGPDHAHPRRQRVLRWLGIALSIVTLGAIVFAVRGLDFADLLRSTPGDPLFWIAFIASYLLVPGVEWLIYRELWRLPPSGMLPLLRKQIANELLLGYSGDAQLYLWVRQHGGGANAAAAVKDVAILSAAAGNVATLAMMAATAPMLWSLIDAGWLRALGISIGLVTFMSLAIFLFRNALFGLSHRELWRIFAAHLLRLLFSILLLTVMWHVLVPQATIAWLLLLATIRLMLSRLPLFPNKDALFAGATIFALGAGSDTSRAIALVAALTIAAHIALLPLTYLPMLRSWLPGANRAEGTKDRPAVEPE